MHCPIHGNWSHVLLYDQKGVITSVWVKYAWEFMEWSDNGLNSTGIMLYYT